MDKCTIVIECDEGNTDIIIEDGSGEEIRDMKSQIKIPRSQLLAQTLVPMIKSIILLSREQLQARILGEVRELAKNKEDSFNYPPKY